MDDQSERITSEEEKAARQTALVLGELSDEEHQQVESDMSGPLRKECRELERVAAALLKADRVASLPAPRASLREAVEAKLANDAVKVELREIAFTYKSHSRVWLAVTAGISLSVLAILMSNIFWYNLSVREVSDVESTELRSRKLEPDLGEAKSRITEQKTHPDSRRREDMKQTSARVDAVAAKRNSGQAAANSDSPIAAGGSAYGALQSSTPASPALPNASHYYITPDSSKPAAGMEFGMEGMPGSQGVPAPNQLAAGPAAQGVGNAAVARGSMMPGRSGAEMHGGEGMYGGAEMSGGGGGMYGGGGEMYGAGGGMVAGGYDMSSNGLSDEAAPNSKGRRYRVGYEQAPHSGAVRFGMQAGWPAAEQYSQIVENRFVSASDEPLSTFSIDVDTASYANARRFLSQNQMPPADAVRIEEFINYFGYDYAAPQDGKPFSVNMEVAGCPWQPAHQLVRIGLKGKEIPPGERPASNIVFLLDVSGSMQAANKLPLLKQAMKLLADQLTESDRVSIVTYAGSAGLALEPTNGESKQTIRDAIDALNASGSTNGSAGIQLAYEKATESFIKDGANRVILATDGDLNVGVTTDDALVELIKEKSASGVFLTVLGFGEGNLKDGKLEKLADNGNGIYAYIDSLREARKVLVEQITGSLVTIAKDVKIKVEFNPAEVAAYRLLGYENRLISVPEFDDDAKDAGEIGAGHTVTALYEIVPAELAEQFASTPSALKYQRPVTAADPPKELTDAAQSGEVLTLYLRYKQPDADESRLSEFTVVGNQRAFDDASSDFRFAAAVASFGMVLRNSEFRGNSSLANVEEIASSAIGSDPHGHRTEFLDLVRKASSLRSPRR